MGTLFASCDSKTKPDPKVLVIAKDTLTTTDAVIYRLTMESNSNLVEWRKLQKSSWAETDSIKKLALENSAEKYRILLCDMDKRMTDYCIANNIHVNLGPHRYDMYHYANECGCQGNDLVLIFFGLFFYYS